jgi:predicted TIM-barrel fold metal-dependent hydrolase
MARLIDAHLHLACDGEAGLQLLEALDLKVLNISVPRPGGSRWRAHAAVFRGLAQAHPERFAWIAGFELPTFRPDGVVEDGYAERVIASLEADLAAGAVGVKIWKSVGMEVRKPSGEYLMVDDPLFHPIYDFLEARGITLLLHTGEPRACWQPLDDPDDPHHGYYRQSPSWHFHGRADVPSHAQIIAARDHLLEARPGLRVVGAHLASLEFDVDEVARRLERYPNFAVDTSARLLDLARQDRDKVRAFFARHRERILFGTDLIDPRPWSSLSAAEVAPKVFQAHQRWSAELAWYGAEAHARAGPGLGLAEDVLEDVLRRNAERWYPGL